MTPGSSEEGAATAFRPLSEGELRYLKNVINTEDDPALVFAWSARTVELFAAAVNRAVEADRPPWMPREGAVTASAVRDAIAEHLSLAGGKKRFGDAIIAPNTLHEYDNVILRLAHIESNVFVQSCMAHCPEGSVLAETGFIVDKSLSVKVQRRSPIAPPDGQRRVFGWKVGANGHARSARMKECERC